MGDDEDDGKRKPNKAKEDDEWLRHPYTGSFIRNPLRVKDDSGAPIILAKEDFDHNCMDEALYGWKQIRVDETSFNEMISNTESKISPRTMKKRAQVHRIQTLPSGFEFVVTLDKSDFARGVSKEQQRGRRKKEPPKLGIPIEKVAIEVNEMGSKALRIESVAEGLMASWNRSNPGFLVQPGELITAVNGKKKTAEMLDELNNSNLLRLTMKHAQASKVDEVVGLPVVDGPRASSKDIKPPPVNEGPRKSSKETQAPTIVVPEPPKKEVQDQTLKPGQGNGGSPRKSPRSMPPPKPVRPG